MNALTNWPIRWEKERYDDARNRVIEHYGRCKGLIAIYEWGSVSNPGISDLDFALVFEEDSPKLPLLKRSFFALDKKTREVLVHPVVYIPRQAYADIKYANPGMSLKKIHGENVRINKLSRKKEKEVSVSLLNDLAIRHYPRDFLGNFIDVRNTLLRLNSLRYTIKSISKLSKKKVGAFEEFSKNVRLLRKHWFEHEDAKQLRELHKKAFGISIEVVKLFSEFMEKKDMVGISSKKHTSFEGIKNRSVFVRSWNPSDAAKHQSGSLLPLILSAQLFEYAKGNGPISNHLKKHLKGSMEYQTALSDVMGKRIGFFNAQARLAERLRHSDFPAFFDYGFRAGKGVNNRLLSLMDKIRY